MPHDRIGPRGWLAFFTAISGVIFAGITALVSLSPLREGDVLAFLGYVGVGGAVVSLFAASATSHASFSSGKIVVVNILLQTTVPVEEIGSVDGGNGITLVLTNGKELSILAYSSSVLQEIHQTRRFREAEARVRGWVGAPENHATTPVILRKRRLRSDMWMFLTGLCVYVVVVGSLLYIFRASLFSMLGY